MRHKFISIQYLRGLAALLVLASHALLYPLVEHTLFYGRMGWLGVILFFVISGFIMVVVTGDERFSAGDFLRRRAIRIVPMYWGATLFAAALAFFLPELFKTTVYDTGELILSLLFIPFHNPESGGIHPLYKLGWTLNYEVFFYVCFALLAFLSAKMRVVWLTLGFVALSIIGATLVPQDAIAKFYTTFMPLAFVAGAWLGYATLRGRLQLLSGKTIVPAAALGAVGLVAGFGVDHANLVEDWQAFIGFLAFATALVLLAVRFETTVPRVKLAELIGDASYSIYLIHIYAVAVVADIAFKFLDPANLWAYAGVSTLAVFGGTLGGIVVYRGLEQPLLGIFSRLFGKRRRTPVAAPAE
ncbi:MAG: acyltransferase [Candidatus Devosia phytovorans]|uniref:Acyltransferase n=1 Tax=Candidatus Devosia phytovorans TaxID=3121372 RepID=A0AAJ5VRB3_9HYPH|nr:acyltransferase [Devosia sp.]WEK02817.1 MAG: acyltransferase [Devosia sp.]